MAYINGKKVLSVVNNIGNGNTGEGVKFTKITPNPYVSSKDDSGATPLVDVDGSTPYGSFIVVNILSDRINACYYDGSNGKYNSSRKQYIAYYDNQNKKLYINSSGLSNSWQVITQPTTNTPYWFALGNRYAAGSNQYSTYIIQLGDNVDNSELLSELTSLIEE